MEPIPVSGSPASTSGFQVRPRPHLRRRSPMLRKAVFGFVGVGLLAAGILRPAQAQFAVIDVASIAQLVQEVQQLEQQVATARSQLAQAQSEYAAITGNRGMQLLLSGTNRNYLPTDSAQFSQVMSGSSSAYPALAATATGLI